jgi:hypothetical protein
VRSRHEGIVGTNEAVTGGNSRIPDPTLSDAVLDRLIHNAYRLELEGEFMWKVHAPLPFDLN